MDKDEEELKAGEMILDEEIVAPEDDLQPGEMILDDGEEIEPDRFWNVAGSSAVLGAGPRVEGLLEAGPAAALGFGSEESNAAYQRKRDEAYAKNTAYRRAKPGVAVTADLLGSAPTALIPGLGQGRIAQAAARGHTVARDLGATDRILRATGYGRNVGGVGSESAALGAKYGTGQGWLSSREDGFANPERYMDAVRGGGIGLALGGGVGKATSLVGRGAREAALIGREVSEAGENVGRTGAVRRVAEELEDAGISTAELRGAMPIPRTVAGTQEKGRLIRQALSNTENPADEYIRLMRAAGHQTQESTLRRHMQDVMDNANSTTPMSIDELASLIPDASGNARRAKNLVDTRRAVAKMPGEHQEGMFNTVMNRQEELLDRTGNALDDMAPVRYQDLTELSEQNKRNSNALYADARRFEHETGATFDLSPVFEEAHRTQVARGGAPRKAIDEALTIMRGNKMADGGYERSTLDAFIEGRSELNQFIEDSLDMGRATASTRVLRDFKAKIDAIVEESNPAWKIANDRHRAGRSVEGAHTAGMKMTPDRSSKANNDVLRRISTINSERSSHRSRLAELRQIDRSATGLSPAQREEVERLAAMTSMLDNELQGYRHGFAEKIQEKLSGTGDMHDPSKFFFKGGKDSSLYRGDRTKKGPRETLRAVFGEDEANTFLAEMERVQRASMTKNQYGGSQTPEMLEKLKEQGLDDQLNAFNEFATINPFGLAAAAGRRIASAYGRRRNEHLGPMFSTMTDDLPAFERLLQTIDEHNATRANPLARRHASGLDRWIAENTRRARQAAPGAAGVAAGRNLIENLLGAGDDTSDYEEDF